MAPMLLPAPWRASFQAWPGHCALANARCRLVPVERKPRPPRIAPRGCYKPMIRPADVDRIAQHAGVSVCGLVHIARRNDWTCADLHRLLFDGASRHEVIASSKAALNCEVGALPDKGFETAPCKADCTGRAACANEEATRPPLLHAPPCMSGKEHCEG